MKRNLICMHSCHMSVDQNRLQQKRLKDYTINEEIKRNTVMFRRLLFRNDAEIATPYSIYVTCLLASNEYFNFRSLSFLFSISPRLCFQSFHSSSRHGCIIQVTYHRSRLVLGRSSTPLARPRPSQASKSVLLLPRMGRYQAHVHVVSLF